MAELRSKLSTFKAEEAGKCYSHKQGVDYWYYYAYGSGQNRGQENKLASRLIGRPQYGDLALVRSGPDDSNNYPEEFSKAELERGEEVWVWNARSE
ncbi:hypothetical protein BDV19DRAFT_393691 [Aspergillus venezuelensis]